MSAGTPPPPPNLRAALDANAVRFVHNQVRLGYTNPQIAHQLQERFPGLPGATAYAVIDRAAAAAEAATAYRFGGAAHVLEARDVRRPDPGRTAWRYTTLVGYQGAGGAVDWVPVTRTYATSQPRGRVEQDAASEVVQWAAAQAGGGNPNYPVTGNVTVINVMVTSVERA